jgi:hypothetical protein
MDAFVHISIGILIVVVIVLCYFVFETNRSVSLMKDIDTTHDSKIDNIVDAVNFNDKVLFDQSKYVHQIYEENNKFSTPANGNGNGNSNGNGTEERNSQYYDMMKNYDALLVLTK